MRGATPVRDALDGAITAIGAAGCETPRLDAELLLADALGVSRERLLSDADRTLLRGHVSTILKTGSTGAVDLLGQLQAILKQRLVDA